MLKLFKGKKTYAAAVAMAGLAIAQWFGLPVPNEAWIVLNAAGLGALRDAMN